MRKIYILSILMAVIVGVSVYLFADTLQRRTLEQAQANRSGVVVAVQFIPANAEITSAMITLKELPDEAINTLAARTLEEVTGAISQYPIEPDEQIFTTRIQKRGEAAEGRLAYVLKPGYRAITLSVDEISGVAGHLTRGDYVDLLVTMRLAEFEENNDIALMIVENLQVLETGKKIVSTAESAAPMEYASVTLACSPTEAIKIHYASQYGIRLVLRPVLDNTLTGETWFPTVFPTEAAPET